MVNGERSSLNVNRDKTKMMKVMSTQAEARISKARQVFAMLKPVWKRPSLSCKKKLRIFLSNAKLVLFYRPATWRTMRDLVNKLKGFVNKCVWSLYSNKTPRRDLEMRICGN